MSRRVSPSTSRASPTVVAVFLSTRTVRSPSAPDENTPCATPRQTPPRPAGSARPAWQCPASPVQ